MKLTLLKYLILLGALGACVYVLLVKHSYTWTIVYATGGLSLGFLLVSIADSMNRSKKAEKRPGTYAYYTPGMITKRVIRAGAYAIATFVFFLSDSKLILFGLPLAALLVSELIDLFINIRNHSYYLYFEENAFVYQLDAVRRIYASHIREIEYRYDIFYLTLTNDKVVIIETEKIEKALRSGFISKFIDWALYYNVSFTEEAKEKLNIKQ